MIKRSFFSLLATFVGVFFVFTVASAATVSALQFTVLDPNGDPLEGMGVQLLDSTSSVRDFAASNASGVVNFTAGYDEGSYTLSFDPTLSYDCDSCSTLVASEEAITVSSASVVEGVQNLGSFTMVQATRIVTVVVTDQDGTPVVGVPVNASEMIMNWTEDSNPGWAYGSTDSSGEFSFAVSETSSNDWFLSVDPQFSSEEASKGYTSAWENIAASEIAATGVTTIAVELQGTDGSIVATLKDQDGNLSPIEENGFASINCFEPWDPSAKPEAGFNSLFFFASLTAGESSATLSVIGGRDYECSAWIEGKAAIAGTVTVPVDGSAALDITVMEKDAQLVVSYVDGDGTVLTDVSGSVDAFTVKDPDGNQYWGDFAWAQLENGTATLDVLGGYTYNVGGFLMEDSGEKGGPGEGDGFGEDPGEGDGFGEDPGEGDGFGDDPSFKSVGVTQADSGKRYIQTYSRETVVAEANGSVSVEMVAQEATGTFSITVLDVNGDPIPYAWVDAMEGDIAEVFGGGGEEGFMEPPPMIGGITDADGVATLYVEHGVDYEIHAFTPNSFGGDVMQPPAQTASVGKDKTKSLTLQELEADWTINITSTVDGDGTVDYAYCFGYDPELGISNFGDLQDGVGSLAFVRDASVRVGCMGYSGSDFYVASEQVVNTGSTKDGSSDITAVFVAGGTYWEDQVTTVSATTTQTIAVGDSQLTIPANCLADSGNVTVTIGTAVGLKVSDDAVPAGSFDLDFADTQGTPITEVSDSCAGLTWTQVYEDETLEALDITEDQIRGMGHYDEDNKTFTNVSSEIDTDANTVTSTISSFSSYSVLGNKGLSTVSKPGKAKKGKLKMKKRQKKAATASWGAVSGASSYRVVLQSYTDSKWKKKKTYKGIDGKQKKFKKLKAGTQYRWHVRACNSAGCGSWSVWKTFTTKGGSA